MKIEPRTLYSAAVFVTASFFSKKEGKGKPNLRPCFLFFKLVQSYNLLVASAYAHAGVHVAARGGACRRDRIADPVITRHPLNFHKRPLSDIQSVC